ncbi:checkpoint protein Hus1/Mec3, partial [Parasitella parasitica]
LFSDYRIESQNHNEINFFFKIPDLLHITKDLSEITRIQVGLKRRGDQHIILFRWTGVNFVGSKSMEQKELPIELVRRDRLELIKEPVTIRTPETYILLPPLTSLKPASEQFKKLSKYITIAANMNGELRIEVESAYAVCSAQFDNLSNPSLSKG